MLTQSAEECTYCAVCMKDIPFAVVVHTVETVPLCIELCEGISNLCNLWGRRILNSIRLTLVDSCDLLTKTFQILFDILLKTNARPKNGKKH